MKKAGTLLKNGKLRELTRSRESSLFLVMVLLCIVIQWRSGGVFFTGNVLTQLAQNYAHTAVLTFGMLMVLLIGGIDISIASTLAFSGMASSMLMQQGYLTNTFSVFAVSTGIGVVCGFVVGLVIAKGKVIPIIATLGMQYIFRGLTYVISDSKWVSADEMLPAYLDFARGSFLGIPYLAWIVIVIFAIMVVLLKWTNFGRQIYEVGSNAEAARISGINIDRIKIIVYTANGAIAGLAGAMFTSKYGSAQSNMATAAEMDVIAACVIGGISLDGGQGSALGALLGVITIAIISKSLSLVGIDAFWQQALKGGIILLAVVINILVQRNNNRKALEGREI